jgi:hypothetical protein
MDQLHAIARSAIPGAMLGASETSFANVQSSNFPPPLDGASVAPTPPPCVEIGVERAGVYRPIGIETVTRAPRPISLSMTTSPPC